MTDQADGTDFDYRPLSRREVAELRGYVAASTTVGRVVFLLTFVAIAGLAFRTMLMAAASVSRGLSHPAWWITPTCVVAWLVYR
jgi:hypothetical protein